MLGRAGAGSSVTRVSRHNPLADGAAASPVDDGITLLPVIMDSVSAFIDDRGIGLVGHFDIPGEFRGVSLLIPKKDGNLVVHT